MTPKEHTAIGIGISAILYPFVGLKSIWFLISSTLIDIDHYFYYLARTRFADFDVKTMYDYHYILLKWKHRNDMLGISAFHTIEFLGIMAAYAFISKSPILIIILSGFIFHFICDAFFLISHGLPFRRAYSFLEYYVRRAKMQKRGIDPDLVHNEAIEFARSKR